MAIASSSSGSLSALEDELEHKTLVHQAVWTLHPSPTPRQSAGLQAPSFIKHQSSPLGRICWDEEFHIVTTRHLSPRFLNWKTDGAGMFRAPVLSGGTEEKEPWPWSQQVERLTMLSRAGAVASGGLGVGGDRGGWPCPRTTNSIPGPRRRGGVAPPILARGA